MREATAREARLPKPRPPRRARRAAPLLALLLVACAGESEPPAAVAVGPIGYSELEVGAFSPRQRERLATLAAFGLAVARDELDRFVEPLVHREEQRLLLQKLAAEIALRQAGVDEAALAAAYRAAPEYELVVRHLVILSERWRSADERAEARRKAEAALRRIQDGEPFAAVAAEVSEEPGAAERGGLLKPGREGSWVPEFWKAARALEVGGTSGVVETEYGYHVLRLEERRPVPLEEVRGRVLGRLTNLAAAAGRAEDWAAREASVLRADAGAIAAWRAGRAPDSVPLASWPGGTYRGRDLKPYLLSLDAQEARRVGGADDAAFRAIVGAAARNALLAKRAEEMGIELSAAETAAAETRWREKARAWAAALGFRKGLEPDAVKRLALEALTAARQSARIAREDVLARAPALRAVYPVALREDAPAAD